MEKEVFDNQVEKFKARAFTFLEVLFMEGVLGKGNLKGKWEFAKEGFCRFVKFNESPYGLNTFVSIAFDKAWVEFLHSH